MLTSKQIERVSKMFTDSMNKHGDELRVCSLQWYTVELYDARYPDCLIQETVPWVYCEFK